MWFWKLPYHSLLRVAHCAKTVCTNNTSYAEYLLPFWVCSKQRTCKPLTIKSPAPSLCKLPWQTASHTHCPDLLLGKLRVSCESPGRGWWKLTPGFLWTSSHESFPLADFDLNPFSGVLLMSPTIWWVLNPTSKPLTPGVVLGIPNIAPRFV